MKRCKFSVVVLCCLLVVCGAEAQNVAQLVLWNADKLGLTPDQKTKVEALQTDLQNQRQDVLDNKKLSRDERVARTREIKENERARIKEVLTLAQQRKLKDLMYPREQRGVSGCITAGTAPVHYTARLDGYPSEYLSHTIRKQDIRLSRSMPTASRFPMARS